MAKKLEESTEQEALSKILRQNFETSVDNGVDMSNMQKKNKIKMTHQWQIPAELLSRRQPLVHVHKILQIPQI